MATQKSPPAPVSKPGDPLDLGTSVAGEEDPGASFDTPGAAGNVCPRCGGTGRQGASSCPDCQGTGKVAVGNGGA